MPVDDGYTVSLLHFNGTDGATSFIDESGKTWTAAGSAQIDTAQSKFGGASLLLDGTTDYISTPDSADFNFSNGDFTIDFWFRAASTMDNFDTWFGIWNSTPANTNYIKFDYGSGGAIRFVVVASSSIVAEYTASSAQTFTAGTWYHLAVVRNGTNILIFKDGTSLTLTTGTAISSSSLPDLTGAAVYGSDRANASRDINGHIDEARISKGIARWTANFTPPSIEYSGSTFFMMF